MKKDNPPKIDIKQLKELVKITDLARNLGIELNNNKQTLCLWHNEETPSLSFNDDKQIFHCFGCGKHGDIIDLYKEVKGVDTRQAITDLAGLAGLMSHQKQDFSVKKTLKGYNHQLTAKKENKGQFNKFYEELVFICGGLDEESEKYLKSDKRGLTDETINRFILCSIKNYTEVSERLKNKFSLRELKEAGLFNDEGNLIFYRHKLLIPFLKDGRVIYIQGRRLDKGEPKYLQLKGLTPPLFNADKLGELKKGERVYICEGVFDAMILEQNNKNAVAILGVNNFKPEQAELFKGLDVFLMFDNDEAGKEAVKKIHDIFLLKGQETKTKRLPENIKDITEYFFK